MSETLREVFVFGVRPINHQQTQAINLQQREKIKKNKKKKNALIKTFKQT